MIDANLVPVLVGLMMSAELETRKEATWALSNATWCGSPDQVEYLVQCGVLPAMGRALHDKADPKQMYVALEGVGNILKAGSLKYGRDNPFVHMAVNAGAPSALAALAKADEPEHAVRAALLEPRAAEARHGLRAAREQRAGGYNQPRLQPRRLARAPRAEHLGRA